LPTLQIYDIFMTVINLCLFLGVIIAIVSLFDYVFVLLKKKN
jgi:hypothetical protein